MSRPISIQEIAQIARVSHSAVSRALRHGSRVNVKTAARIRDRADRRGYHPGLAARPLVTRRTQTIGFDDLFVAPYRHPPLGAMGRRAMQILLDLLSRRPEEIVNENWHVRVHGEKVRQSTTKPEEP